MDRSTADAFNVICRLGHHGKLDDVSQDKKQNVATGLICDKLHTQDFAVGLQKGGTDQSLSHCGHPAPHATCVTCFSSWAY